MATMNNFKQIKLMNDSTILALQKLKKDTSRNDIITEILKDEACFFKMNKVDSYTILQDIGVADGKIPTIYEALISPNSYFYLMKSGKLKETDEDLIIKYKNYDPDNIF